MRLLARLLPARGRLGALSLLLVAPLVVLTANAAHADQQITSSGPLTRVFTSSDLNCAIDHAGDTSSEWYAQTACGTLLVVNGVLYGPQNIPAGSAAGPRTSWTPVSQTAVTGSGSSADPYKIVTVVTAGATGVKVTQTDTYVVGDEATRTDTVISNTSNATVTTRLYRAGDCYLQNSDIGFGRVDAASGSVACTATQAANSRIEQFTPLSSGSHYYEAYYDDMWAVIGSKQPFPDTCGCATSMDNAIGLSWDQNVGAGQSVTRSTLAAFSPLGKSPLIAAATADSSSVSPGGGDGYSVTVSNTNPVAVTVNSVTDTLPAGFSYVAGSTTGATTSNPSVSAQQLTFAGPFSVPGSGSVTLHFNVVASTTPGTYYDNANASASGGYTVQASGDTAQITVTQPADTVAPTCTVVRKNTTPISAEATLADSGSGVASVVITRRVNANVTIAGQTNPTSVTFSPPVSSVVLTATRIDNSQRAATDLTITDAAGNVSYC